MKMKNLILFFAALVMSFAFFTGPTCVADDDDQIIIVIGEGDFGGSPIIRSPGIIPIEATYYSASSTIFVNFLYDLGYVSVEIENLFTGAYSQTFINAIQGVHPFVVSGDEGIYEIRFTLPGGLVFIGEFEID